MEKITGKRGAFYEADISDAAVMEKIFSENTIDAVIHFARLKAVSESIKKPIMYYRNNIYTTLIVLKTMEKQIPYPTSKPYPAELVRILTARQNL